MTKRKLLAISVASVVSNFALAQPPQIEEISVIGQYVPDEKRATSSVANVVGEQQFTRSGDSNIAEGLKRIAGLSTVDGKFVYVRGLGERYSTTLLNGAILPSPEPINRVVPMDMFPTGVLDSVLVQKTYSAQFPSQFGGGVLQLRTKKSTDEAFWTVTSAVGFTPSENFDTGLTMPGGDTDFLGVDDGFRDIPQPLLEATAGDTQLRRFSSFLGEGYTPEELEVIGQSLRNQYEPTVEDLPANYDLATSFGNFHDIGSSGAKINYFGAVDYSNSWNTDRVERNTWKTSSTSEGGLDIDDDQDVIGTTNNINISGIFTVGLDLNINHNIRLTSSVLRLTDNRITQAVGELAAEDFVRINEIEWIERELQSNQLQGDHFFPEFNELAINWRVSDISANRDAPDTRRYRYDLVNEGGDTFRFSTRSDGNVRRFETLEDNASDFGLDLSMTFYGGLNSVITTQAGYMMTDKDRDSEIRRFTFFDQGSLSRDEDLLTQPLENILSNQNISPDGFELREITRPTDNYVAVNESEAFYVQGEVNFDERLRLSAGLRNETFDQSVQTFDLFRPDDVVQGGQSTDDLLPALSATFINYNHQFRLAYSETLSRPDFRELSPAAFTNPISGREVVGNPELEVTGITNYDFRWEWYLGFEDYLSFGLFFKEFDKPIEATIQPGPAQRQTFANAESGENRGAEFEVFKRLDFLGGRWEDFYFQGNVSFIDSQVQIKEEDRGILTNSDRPLQGQSDWLLNAQFGYEPISGVTATVLYHYFGARIAEVGVNGAPDLIQEPFGELNMIYIHELNDRWRITAKAKNIMDESADVTQGPFIATSLHRGRQFSLQVDWALGGFL